MIEGHCHCNSVSFQITKLPEKLVDCNCSICRRLGALWAHVPVNSVTITAPENATIRYIQGDKMLAMHTCRQCGCTTHWESLLDDEDGHMAVNFRMCSPEDIDRFEIKRFDGADTWTFLD